jgi:hypothetical protein
MLAADSVHAWAEEAAARPSVPLPHMVARPPIGVGIDEDGPPAKTPIQGELAMQRPRWGDVAQTQRNPSSCVVFSFGVTPTMTVGGWFVNGSQCGIRPAEDVPPFV